MKWLQALFEKVGVSSSVRQRLESVHVNDLGEWLEKRAQEIISKHKLDEDAIDTANHLKDKRWVLECKLDEWQSKVNSVRQSDVSSILSEARKVAGLIEFPEKMTVERFLSFHLRVEPELERFSKKIESGPFHQQFSVIFAGPEVATAEMNPLLKELVEINGLCEAFEQRVVQSGFSKVNTLTKRAVTIEKYVEDLRQLQQALQVDTAKLATLTEKQKEKEADLLSLQQNQTYTSFLKIKDERATLIAEIEKAPTMQERFELKQKVDVLEKSIGNRDFILRLEEAIYRLDHFNQQIDKFRQEISVIEEELEELVNRRGREIDMFMNLVKISLGREIEVKV